MIAALYVDPRGCYAGFPDVDPWDEVRDARLYPGPHPVVAHPPCSRWCRYAHLIQARHGHCVGDDGGCFAAALRAVRTWGGVLEHPAYSIAWKTYDLPRPPRGGGWVRGLCGGYACRVEQGHYGHPARKATWLYAYGTELPQLVWGESTAEAVVGWCRNRSPANDPRHRVSGRRASATPEAFRDLLLGMARSALFSAGSARASNGVAFFDPN